jgi:hypothetical protein
MAEPVRPIAWVVCGVGEPHGPLYFALAYEGFDVREVRDPAEVEAGIGPARARGCVLLVEAERLAAPRRDTGWGAFLRAHPGLPLVVASLQRVDEDTRAAVRAARGILLEGPFDAAAVVAAARRACPMPPARVRPLAGSAQSGAGASASA